MIDKTALPENTIASTGISENVGEGAKSERLADASVSQQGIFDQRFSTVMDPFGQQCERCGIETAIAIAIHPGENHPMVFVRGHQYDIASLLAEVLKQMKKQLYTGLNSEPRYEEI